MKRERKWASGAIVSGLIISACSPIPVNRGPFEINSDAGMLGQKASFLNQLQNTQISGERPNIILILVDDLGKHDLAMYDPRGIETPHIQNLATNGITFLNAFSSSPVCSPSRAGLFTGRYPQRYGFERQPMNRYSRSRIEYFFVDHFIDTKPMRLLSPMADVPMEEMKKQGIPPEEILISELLQSGGYKTGICGKWHLGFQQAFLPNRRGFDFHYGFYEAFSLYSPLKTPGIIESRHPYYADKHIWNQKRNGSCAIRINDSIVNEDEYLTFAIANQSVRYIEEHRNEPFFLVAAFNAPHTPFQVPLDYYNMFPHIEDENKRVYYGMIAALDDGVGMITNVLDSLGLSENTLIIFVSDNGGATYTGATDNGSLKAGKFSQFEGGVNVPMIFSWPQNIVPGEVYENPVSLLDIFPTIAKQSGLELPATRSYDGVDLIPYLKSSAEIPHKYLFWRTDFNKAIRTSHWKLLWNTRDNQVFLYDVTKNNDERYNVAEEYPQVVSELQSIFRLWETEMKPPSWPGVMEFKFDINGEVTWWAI